MRLLKDRAASSIETLAIMALVQLDAVGLWLEL
jgi:hypothetical protein